MYTVFEVDRTRVWSEWQTKRQALTICCYIALDWLYPGYNLCEVSEVSSWTCAGLQGKKLKRYDSGVHLFSYTSIVSEYIRMRSSHVSSLAVVVVGWTVILQHVLDDVTSGPAGEHQLAVLEAHILRHKAVSTETVGRPMFWKNVVHPYSESIHLIGRQGSCLH